MISEDDLLKSSSADCSIYARLKTVARDSAPSLFLPCGIPEGCKEKWVGKSLMAFVLPSGDCPTKLMLIWTSGCSCSGIPISVGPTTVISGRVTGTGIPDLQVADCGEADMRKFYQRFRSKISDLSFQSRSNSAIAVQKLIDRRSAGVTKSHKSSAKAEYSEVKEMGTAVLGISGAFQSRTSLLVHEARLRG
jgi:hypothetical protein